MYTVMLNKSPPFIHSKPHSLYYHLFFFLHIFSTMSEYKYVSLKDVLRNQSNPKLEPKVVSSEEEPDFQHVSVMLKNKFPPNAASSSSFSVSENDNGEEAAKKKRTTTKKKAAAKKKKKGGLLSSSSLKHSRSDDPLVYMEFGGEDGGVFSPGQDLQVLCQELDKFSWEDRNTLKSKFLSESDAEEENEEED
ncbi:hypothetical protein ACP275_06G085800 [Erythranthe tilingii]